MTNLQNVCEFDCFLCILCVLFFIGVGAFLFRYFVFLWVKGRIMRKILITFTLLASFNAIALESFLGKVTTLEPTYLPGAITFMLDSGNATCPKGTWLKWAKTEENNKIVYSTLMAALASGKRIRFHMNENDTECKGQYIHIVE